MSKSAQLKRKAAEFEQKRQYDRALATYAQAIDAAAGNPEELDIPLYNRVGDLHLRLGELDKAVMYYETAVDLYAEGGFFNNAIALCNKVLRHAPDRSVIYYKLGKISARKGFNSDAKQNFLEYAARMEKGGDTSEGFRALKEFADLCPGQDDVRLMLAEQLARAGKTQEALEQLQIVYEAMLAEDRGAEATATLERIRVLDPNFTPRAAMSRHQARREGLVFLDLGYGKRVGTAGTAGTTDPNSTHGTDASARPLDESPLAGLTPVEDPLSSMVSDESRGAGPVMPEFQSTSLAPDDTRPTITPLAIEHTSFGTFASASTATHSDEAAPTTDQSAEQGMPLRTAPVGSIDDTVAMDLGATDSMASSLAGYVAALSSEVGTVTGGLPGDLGVLPIEAVQQEQATEKPLPRSDGDFVDLNAWLAESEPPKNSRMKAEEEDKSENAVQTDFSEMLKTFKAGVAANVDESDSDSHYDLGVAYMEMGLFDEAIGQFQKVMRGDASPERRVRAYESLGQSFIEKAEYEVAISSLGGALKESGLTDTKLVGVLYLLGHASEHLGRWPDAEGYYCRVFAVDIHFRDIGECLKRAEHHA